VAIAHVSTSGSDTSSGATITISFTVASGSDRILIGWAGWRDDTQVITGMTFDGNSLTEVSTILGTIAAGNNQRSACAYRLIAPDVKTADFVATWGDTTVEHPLAGVSYYTGVDQTTPTGTPSTGEDSQLPADTLTITPASAVDDLVVDLHCGTQAMTYGGGQTERLAVDGVSDIYSTEKAGAATSTSMSRTWTSTSGIQMVMLGFALKPVVAASGRIMSSLAAAGGLAGLGGIAGRGGGLAG